MRHLFAVTLILRMLISKTLTSVNFSLYLISCWISISWWNDSVNQYSTSTLYESIHVTVPIDHNWPRTIFRRCNDFFLSPDRDPSLPLPPLSPSKPRPKAFPAPLCDRRCGVTSALHCTRRIKLCSFAFGGNIIYRVGHFFTFFFNISPPCTVVNRSKKSSINQPDWLTENFDRICNCFCPPPFTPEY